MADVKKEVKLTELIAQLPSLTLDLPKFLNALYINYTVYPNTRVSVGQYFEKTVKKYPHNKALIYKDQSWTYQELNQWVNRLANQLLKMGLKKGDVVAILLENRPEMIALSMALAKIGCIASLLNTAQRNQPLKHSILLSKPKLLLIGEELLEHYLEIKDEALVDPAHVYLIKHPEISAQHSTEIPYFDIESAAFSDRLNIRDFDIRAKDPCLYIFTSGTTGGLPKAAIFSHGRWVKAYSAFGLTALRLNSRDIVYVPLPFYHATAIVVCWSSVIAGGAAMVMKNKFSVTDLWPDIQRYQATGFGYIGELCMYLLNAQPHPMEQNNSLTKMLGNGMRPAIWQKFKSRFGVEQIAEFYASSEGNIAFFNVFNVDCTMGFTVTGFAIVQYDKKNEKPIQDKKGRFIKVKTGETGLLLGKINKLYPYDGYTEKSKTEKTILRNVFKKGDAWFNTGDLVRNMGYRHTQFVDRVGDTFRWKGENVATTEVEMLINQFEGVSESVVYGVEIPNHDGRAGMANIVLQTDVKNLDLDTFSEFLHRQLPAYAVPLFIRFSQNTEMTGTFKYKKFDLQQEGYDINKVNTPVYFLHEKNYVVLTSALMQEINSGLVKV